MDELSLGLVEVNTTSLTVKTSSDHYFFPILKKEIELTLKHFSKKNHQIFAGDFKFILPLLDEIHYHRLHLSISKHIENLIDHHNFNPVLKYEKTEFYLKLI